MSIKSKIYFAMMIVCAVFFTSCQWWETMRDPYKPIGPEYKADVVWKLKTAVVSALDEEKCYGDYLYMIKGGEDFYIVKIDLNTGTHVWTSEKLSGREGSSVIQNGENLFISTNWGAKDTVLYCLADATGKLKASIHIENAMSAWNGEILSYDKWLFWGADGLIQFDPSLIDFTKKPTDKQHIELTVLWDKNIGLGPLPIASDGVVYALSSSTSLREGEYIKLGAIEIVSGNLLWEKEFIPPEPNAYHISGSYKNVLHIEDDNLFIVDRALGCYNKRTGDTIFEVIQTKEALKNEFCVGLSALARGAVEYHNDKLYYYGRTDSLFADFYAVPEKYQKNILCVDGKTGEVVWAQKTHHDSSLFGKPNIINGKLFLLTASYLYVYNAENGKLIGIQENNAWGTNMSFAYKDMYVYIDRDIQNNAIVTAIRAK